MQSRIAVETAVRYNLWLIITIIIFNFHFACALQPNVIYDRGDDNHGRSSEILTRIRGAAILIDRAVITHYYYYAYHRRSVQRQEKIRKMWKKIIIKNARTGKSIYVYNV